MESNSLPKSRFLNNENAKYLYTQVKFQTKLPLNKEFAEQILLFMKGIWVSKPVSYYRQETSDPPDVQLEKINNTLIRYATEYAQVCFHRMKITDEAEDLLEIIDFVLGNQGGNETNYADLVKEVNRLKKGKGIRAQAWISLLQCVREDILTCPNDLIEGLSKVLSKKVRTEAEKPIPQATIEGLIEQLRSEAHEAFGMNIEDDNEKNKEEKNKIVIPLAKFKGIEMKDGEVVIWLHNNERDVPH